MPVKAAALQAVTANGGGGDSATGSGALTRKVDDREPTALLSIQDDVRSISRDAFRSSR